METTQSKVAIVGAGSVGTSLAYATLINRYARNVALYDVNATKVEAEVLDLAHGTQFFSPSAISGGADIAVVDDSDVVVITAGARQKPGQTRLDLAGANTRILESLMPQLLAHAPDAIYVLVTNPCDVLTVAAQQISGLPPSRVFASGTVLDSSRLRWLLAQASGVASPSVHALMIGEHGDSEFALWSSATIGQVPLVQWRDTTGRVVFTAERRAQLERNVSQAAYKVIAGKGATNYAIGVAGAHIIHAILSDAHLVLPVSTLLDDYHGVSGVAMSVPSIVTKDGISRQLPLRMDEAELARFHASAEALAASGASLGL